jgi:hypothetical protein
MAYIVRTNALPEQKLMWPVIGTAVRQHLGRYAELAATNLLPMNVVTSPAVIATGIYATRGVFSVLRYLESWHVSMGRLIMAVGSVCLLGVVRVLS